MEQQESTQRLTTRIDRLESTVDKLEKENTLLVQRLGDLGLHTKKLQQSVVQSLTSKVIQR